MTNKELINKALEAKRMAITPTGYYCGAALLSASGKVYTGCNLGSNDGLYNICAERLAISKMLSEEGKIGFSKIAVVGGHGDEATFTTPCGICRQLIAEFGKEIEVICGYEENDAMQDKTFKIEELLPESFNM